MMFITNSVLLTLSILQIFFLTENWPTALIPFDSLPRLLSNRERYDLFCGFAIGTALATCVTQILGKKWLGAIATIATGTVLITLYFYLPIVRTYAPTTASTAMAFGIAFGIATTYLCARSNTKEAFENQRKTWSFCFLFSLLALNLLLIVAPNSAIIPAGFEAPTEWSATSLTLQHDDSVAIRNNLIFVTLRAVLHPLVGQSLLINNIVSMVLCAVGVGFLASGARLLGGTIFGFVALTLVVTDRWVLTAALSGNLPVTLITSCGLLFFAAIRVIALWRDRRLVWSKSVCILVLATTLFALYSYAAVRIPFFLSTTCLVLLTLFLGRASISRSLLLIAIHIAAPLALAVGIVATVAYSGDITLLRRDLVVEWPPESWRPHPGAGGLANFILIHNPDTPIWLQIARPSDGQNFSVVWRRTPGEIFRAFMEHASNILHGLADLFCLQPCLFFLLVAALIRILSLPSPHRQQGLLTLVWSGLWLMAYLLVADATAYRRGVSFSAMSSVCAAFCLFTTTRNRKTTGVICGAALTLCALRFPLELGFTNTTLAKATMFTVCSNGNSIRELLTSPRRIDQDTTSYIVPLSSYESSRENSCLAYAVQSKEWKRFMPQSRTMQLPAGSLLTRLQSLESSEAILLHCSLQSAQDPIVDEVCRHGHPTVSAQPVVPMNDGGLPNAWLVLNSVRQQ